ncbi:hypothetical protein [Flavobacterium caeni]|uniref:Uncharacterized protein n=1 Tax=Flavobacterium caeni TaxID=490189 RepID=A0A1G5AQU2_9FLAO|nr:hypothetical protein [Flavobacterium caeni]SCX80190.1 hypothetical protein SAMN02927903_00113 [Flavobacterium caeni]
MDYPNYKGQRNKNTDGYKVPGDGNQPNKIDMVPGNESFAENPHAMTHKTAEDIPGQQYDTGDKAFHDSSKADFSLTVSNFVHAGSQANTESTSDGQAKAPDGDR